MYLLNIRYLTFYKPICVILLSCYTYAPTLHAQNLGRPDPIVCEDPTESARLNTQNQKKTSICDLPEDFSDDQGSRSFTSDQPPDANEKAQKGYVELLIAKTGTMPQRLLACLNTAPIRMQEMNPQCNATKEHEESAYLIALKFLNARKINSKIEHIRIDPEVPLLDHVKKTGVILEYLKSKNKISSKSFIDGGDLALAISFWKFVYPSLNDNSVKILGEYCKKAFGVGNDVPSESYVNKLGHFRFYYNPKSFLGKLGYSVASTVSPFTNEAQIRKSTNVPKSLAEVDFFENYANEYGGEIKTDPITGNRIGDQRLGDGSIDFDGEKHWNILRFFINPHFTAFRKIQTEKEMRTNATADIYKYFLCIDKGNRDLAWAHAKHFMKKNVDPILNGKFLDWMNERMSAVWPEKPIITKFSNKGARFRFLDYADSNAFLNTIVLKAQDANEKLFDTKASNQSFSKEDMIQAITLYGIEIRKQNPKTAKENAVKFIEEASEVLEADIKDLEQGDDKLEIVPALKPPDYDQWSSGEKDRWFDDHPEAFVKKKVITPKTWSGPLCWTV